jgi:hypothetical protein
MLTPIRRARCSSPTAIASSSAPRVQHRRGGRCSFGRTAWRALEAWCETPAPVRTDGEFELPVEFLDRIERELVLAPMPLLGGYRLTLDDLAGQGFITHENVHRIGEARPLRAWQLARRIGQSRS